MTSPRTGRSPVAALTDQSLVVHLFVATTGPRRRTAYRRLRDLWEACGPLLGMEHPAAATGLPDTVPRELDDLPAGGALAARRSRDGLHQAVLRRRHDLLFLSVALSPSVGDRGAWAAWEERWTEVAGPTHEWALGEARLFVAYRPLTDDGAAGESGTEDAVRSALPSAEPPVRLGPGTTAAHPALTVWEVVDGSDGSEGRHLRRFVVVTTDRDDQPLEAERWLWSQGGSAPPAFVRYLADASRLRYEMRVHGAHAGDPPGDTTGIVDDALAALDRLPSHSGPPPESWSVELTRWRHRLLSLIAGSAGLTQRITRLREMRSTVRIAEANMRALTDAAGLPQDAHGPFAEDLALANWFAQTLEDSLVHLQADCERARDALAALTVEAETALQRRREVSTRQEAELQRRQGEITLLQNAFLGAVLMVLTAVQTFAYRIPFLAPPAVPALITLLGALALLLATLVLWLTTPQGTRGPGGVGALIAGLVGAAAGWLGVTVIAHALTGRASSVPLTWAVAAPSYACGWLFMRRRLRREGAQ